MKLIDREYNAQQDKYMNTWLADNATEVTADFDPNGAVGSTVIVIENKGVYIKNNAGKWQKFDMAVNGGEGDGEKINNQDKTITENGTYTADDGYTGLGTVVVNVASGGEEGDLFRSFIERTITEFSDDKVERVGPYAFAGSDLETANFPNATTINKSAFAYCKALKNVAIPSAKRIEESAFHTCSSMTSANFQNATHIGWSAFIYSDNLENADFPNATYIGSYSFFCCFKLKSANLQSATDIMDSAFADCSGLLSVRLPATPPTLSTTNAFDRINAACVFYIPTGSLTAYQNETNWSALTSTYTFTEEDR